MDFEGGIVGGSISDAALPLAIPPKSLKTFTKMYAKVLQKLLYIRKANIIFKNSYAV